MKCKRRKVVRREGAEQKFSKPLSDADVGQQRPCNQTANGNARK